MKHCHHCGAEWTAEDRPGYNATCLACDAYIYVCLNCRFCDRNLSTGCQLTTSEPVRQKDRPNFCDDFKFADRPAAGPTPATEQPAESAREKFERLFRKP